jgi:hypothetical protein
MQVLVKLTIAGADTGPFNLFTNTNYTTPILTNVSKAALVLGMEITTTDDVVSIRVTSIGNCANSIDIPITRVTPTTTTTTTAPLPCYDFAVDAGQIPDEGGSITTKDCIPPYATTVISVNKGGFFFLCKGNVTSTTPGMIITKNLPCTPVVSQVTGSYGNFNCTGGVVGIQILGSIGTIYYNATKIVNGIKLYSDAACTTLINSGWTWLRLNGSTTTRFVEVLNGVVTQVYAEGSTC